MAETSHQISILNVLVIDRKECSLKCHAETSLFYSSIKDIETVTVHLDRRMTSRKPVTVAGPG